MQFNNIFVAAAVLFASTVPAVSAAVTFTAFAGADCTGAVVSSISNVGSGECAFFTNAGSARSWSYSGVPSGKQVLFYESGGAHDKCTNGATLTLGSGSGCGTAPAGFNIESAKWQ